MRAYRRFSYMVPSRTEVKLSRGSLIRFEAEGWWAQYKRNGSRSLVFVPPDRRPFVSDEAGRRYHAAWNRHGEPHRSWAFTDAAWAIFAGIKGCNWYVFDGELLHHNELLHHKTPHLKNIHFLYDVLVFDGVYLIGTSYRDRLQLLHSLFPATRHEDGHHIVNDYTWIARTYMSGFTEIFDAMHLPEDEGLVLKDPDGVYRTTKANSWMAKIRLK